MWEPNGRVIDSEAIGSLELQESLFEFEGEALTFVAHDLDGDLLLVHNLCVADRVSRYLVSPIDSRILSDLKAGRLDVHSALRQPRSWIADVEVDDTPESSWRIRTLYRIDFDSVPKDHLPRPGVMITPDLDPLFRLRLVGPGVGPGRTSAADVKLAAQAAESGLRGLARLALDEKKKAGRVSRDIRHYSDLPYQFSRAASFEIAFGRPLDRLPGVDDEVIAEMGSLLERGLKALRLESEDLAKVEGLDSDQTFQLFEVIKALTPPTQGGVERVEVGGTMVDRFASSTILTRDDRARSNRRIKAARKVPRKVELFRITGVIEEADQGAFSFTLRQLEPPDDPAARGAAEIRFRFEEPFYDDVIEAFNSLERMAVVGEWDGSGYDALAIRPEGDSIGDGPEAKGPASE